MTLDHGGEVAKHTHWRQKLGVQISFCDPYASWQKSAPGHQRDNQRDQQMDLGKELQTALHKDPELLRGLLILNPEDARALDALMQTSPKTVEKPLLKNDWYGEGIIPLSSFRENSPSQHAR